MRVLLVTGSFPPMKCGVGDYSCNLAKSLAACAEIQIGVLTSVFDSNESEREGLEVFPIMKSWGLAETLKVIKIIRYWSPDIVHIQYPTGEYRDGLLEWFLPMISFLMRRKVVQTWHEGYSRRNVPKLLLKAVVPGGLVVVRPQYKEKLLPVLRWALRNKRFVFIRNASVFPKIALGEQEKDILRRQYLRTQKRLILFLGFVYPHKGVELLFEIADPALDQIVITGKIVDEGGDYHKEIMRRALAGPWLGKVTITGFLPTADVSALLAVTDAVVLPFRDGGGEWNTSIHAAVLQGTFVITTSVMEKVYDVKRNVYYAGVDNVQEMKSALGDYAGRRRAYDHDVDRDEWGQIAAEHHSSNESLLSQ
ncbi:MAG: glycosyltransferase [Dehalococcoidia bacterium]|nr:glycosyltransferase [Dehalococcoidia bacterium]